MIDQALKSYNIELKNSWMIGDKQSDIDLAHNAGIDKSIYIGDNKEILNATYSFASIKKCLLDFDEESKI